MRISRFYCPQAMHEGLELCLKNEIANYIGRVLRLKPGNEVRLFNGEGIEFQATISSVERREVTVKIEQPIDVTTESQLRTHLGQVISRGERMDYAIQKATELGVSTITPLTSDFCEVKLAPDRQQKRQKHWQQVAISACEQCGRATIPIINEVSTVGAWMQKHKSELLLVLHPGDGKNALETQDCPNSVSILIGPEGGLSDQEVANASELGCVPVPLGTRILRTETAPVVALTLIQWLWGDFKSPQGHQ